MTTYANRISSVFSPYWEEAARRWSLPSSSERPAHVLASPRNPIIESSAAIPRRHYDAFHSSEDEDDDEDGIVLSPSSLPAAATPIRASAQTAPITLPSSSSEPSEPTALPEPQSAPESASEPLPAMPSDISPTAELPAPSPPSPSKAQTLPEDDGQGELRRKLLSIANSGLPERDRARMMHEVMTEKYRAFVARNRISTPSAEGGSPSTPLAQAPPAAIDPSSPLEGRQDTPPAIKYLDAEYKLLPEDVRETYYTGKGSSENDAEELGCEHYRRSVKLQCSTCERWYTCRFCHDDKEDHALVRKDTKNMLCMPCGRAQPAQQDCRFCGNRSARYYCNKCKLWDDDPEKNVYHCNDCGICRIGRGLGKDFFHCKQCNVCMSIKLEGNHRCIERSTQCDCPICGEFMFTSTLTVVFMSCGHSIHEECYYEHMKSSYRCPTCARSIMNMEHQFRALDQEIETQPLPAPYASWRCYISCNDCSAKSDVPFHFLGLRCDNCKSYNTNQVKMLRPEDGAGGVTPAEESPADPVSDALLSSAALGVQGVSSNGLRGGALVRTGSHSPSMQAAALAQLSMANQAAQEARERYLAMDLGDEDLMAHYDEGWESETGDEQEPENEAGYYSEGDDMQDEDSDEDDDDDDDDEPELINLIGHL